MPEKEGKATKANAPPLPFQVAQPKADRYLKLLVYGAPGVGKTYLAGTAVQVDAFKDVLILDVEGGTQTLTHPEFKKLAPDVVPVTDFSTFAKVYEYLRAHTRLRDTTDPEAVKRLRALNERAGAKPDRHYQTVVIDSLTEVAKLAMYKLLDVSMDRASLDMEPPFAELRDWGRVAEMIRLLVRAFRNLPMHVVIICAELSTQDDTGRLFYGPALSGKLASEIPGFVDVVGRLRASADKEGNVRRRLYVAPVGPWAAKDRLHEDGLVYIENPTIARILSGAKEE